MEMDIYWNYSAQERKENITDVFIENIFFYGYPYDNETQRHSLTNLGM